jgi:uncharacterized protein YdaU (DUF1376 family)
LSKAPAFQLYSNDFLVDTLDWTIEEIGIYTRLLFYQWTNGKLPGEHNRLARIAGCSVKKFDHNWKNVSPKFIQNGDGYLRNERLENTRIEQEQYIEMQREKGKKRADQRWHNNIATATNRLQPEGQPEGQPKDGSSSSSSIKKKEFNKKEKISQIPPPIEDVIAYCKERNNGVDPQKWFDAYQAKGWMIGKSKMVDWKAAVRTWEKPNDKPKKKYFSTVADIEKEEREHGVK